MWHWRRANNKCCRSVRTIGSGGMQEWFGWIVPANARSYPISPHHWTRPSNSQLIFKLTQLTLFAWIFRKSLQPSEKALNRLEYLGNDKWARSCWLPLLNFDQINQLLWWKADQLHKTPKTKMWLLKLFRQMIIRVQKQKPEAKFDYILKVPIKIRSQMIKNHHQNKNVSNKNSTTRKKTSPNIRMIIKMSLLRSENTLRRFWLPEDTSVMNVTSG